MIFFRLENNGLSVMILIDTHVLVWLSEGNLKLGKAALNCINDSLKSDELYISAISFWEVAMLVKKHRIELSISVELWRKSLLDHGLKEIPLTGDIALQSALLENFHGDPADRMIVATAIHSAMKLCTADKKILDWQNSLFRIDANG